MHIFYTIKLLKRNDIHYAEDYLFIFPSVKNDLDILRFYHVVFVWIVFNFHFILLLVGMVRFDSPSLSIYVAIFCFCDMMELDVISFV